MAAIADPRTLLEPDGTEKHSYLYYKAAPITGATLGFITAVVMNFTTRKPLLSGIQTHILLTAGGGALFAYFDKRKNEYVNERDAIYRHYISLHPEDFPVPERKQYKDIFKPWLPVR